MTSPGSVEGHERIRLFAALPLPADIVDHLSAWQHRELAGAAGTRLVPPQNLHVTLAFLGWTPASEADGIAEALREAGQRVAPPALTVSRYRETRSVGMLALEDDDGRAARLAETLAEGLERLGVYEREARRWIPHVTVLRFRRPPRLRPALPDLGRISPSEAALYHSVLRPSGAQYEILQSVPLGG